MPSPLPRAAQCSGSPGARALCRRAAPPVAALCLALCLVLCLAVVMCLPSPAAMAADAADIAGSVKTLTGSGQVVRAQDPLPAQVGMHVMSGDVLQTGPQGSMGILFRDDTALSLGPGSQVVIDEFLFDPAQDSLSLLTKVSKGTAAYVTGQIAKLRPEAVAVRTPLSTIGIRGTHFVVKVEGD